MVKTYTVGGIAAYRIRLETIFTANDFARALSEESFHRELIPFIDLTKTEAMNILKERLQRHGRGGENEGLDDIGDRTEDLNIEYQKAIEWVNKNFPYLNTTK